MALSRAIIAIAILFISFAARAEKRVALVVGNSAYATVGALANPVRDAKAVAEALRAAGFAEVAEGYDLSKPQFDAALKRFGDATSGAHWALIYYAGHGIGIGGETYLLPVDAVLKRAEHADDEAISLSRLRAKADGAKSLRMVILDSCRSNPFAARLAREAGAKRAISRGLPLPALLEGDELIAYATRENDVADDGQGQHSPFTTAFLQHLQEQGLEVRFLFGKVRDSVQAATGRAQTPTTYGDLGGAYFYFRAPKPKEETSAPLPPLSEAAEAWRILRDTGSEAELEAFVKRFGETVFGDFARARLAEIRKNIAAAVPKPEALKAVEEQHPAPSKPPGEIKKKAEEQVAFTAKPQVSGTEQNPSTHLIRNLVLAHSVDGPLVFSPSNRFALFYANSRLRKLDLDTGQVSVATDREIRSIVFTPDARYALSNECREIDCEWKLALWDLSTDKIVHSFPKESRSFPKESRSFIWTKKGIKALAVSPDGRFVLMGGCAEEKGHLVFNRNFPYCTKWVSLSHP